MKRAKSILKSLVLVSALALATDGLIGTSAQAERNIICQNYGDNCAVIIKGDINWMTKVQSY